MTKVTLIIQNNLILLANQMTCHNHNWIIKIYISIGNHLSIVNILQAFNDSRYLKKTPNFSLKPFLIVICLSCSGKKISNLEELCTEGQYMICA